MGSSPSLRGPGRDIRVVLVEQGRRRAPFIVLLDANVLFPFSLRDANCSPGLSGLCPRPWPAFANISIGHDDHVESAVLTSVELRV
jgi:hypothetical protein